MNMRELEIALAAADPVDQGRLSGLELEAMEAELLADLDGEQPASAPLGTEAPRWRRPRRLALALGTATLAAAVAAIFLLAGGASEHPSRAYGADLVRFAESSPLLLLEEPGWRVQNANEERRREGIEGSMEFVTGKPIPYESITVTGNEKVEHESGMLPPAVRQRRVELFWRLGTLEEWISMQRETLHPHGQRWIELPVLGTTAQVDTRAEFFANQGGPGNRQMVALWAEDGYVLQMRAAVPDLAAFEERLGWLTKVDLQTWLNAMPAKVVKAGDHDVVVREMLKGIPVPSDFTPALVPDEGLNTDRSRVANSVTNTVSCLWFRQWGEARAAGHRAAMLEAERAMETAKRWPIVRQIEKEGGYPETLLKLVKSMPSGVWQFGPHRWRLLPKAEGLGCAREGIPVLPWKQRRQREHGVPLPPR
jgi:hypothetical protein